MLRTFKKIIHRLGFNVSRTQRFRGTENPYSDISLMVKHKIVDLGALAHIGLSIPGMISHESGQILYTLCYMQQLRGDVVEIGSWQGRSTSFLARAVKNSQNGKLFAIDHFKGNIGKEHFYVVDNKPGLDNLKAQFLSNIERLGLTDSVSLLDMPNELAAKEIPDTNIRFLFIDADHTKTGVEKDIELFFPKLMNGSIVVFDDFSEDSLGVVEAIDSLLKKKPATRIMSYQNTLVLMI